MDKLERTELGQSEFEMWLDRAEEVVTESTQLTDDQKRFLAAQEALDELNTFFMGMTVEEVETALEGLREYSQAVLRDREILQGWARHEEQ